VVLAEPITLWQLGGGLCVLGGVGLTTQRRW
jgi:drug/metabolite transporter (DMT)-like permease